MRKITSFLLALLLVLSLSATAFAAETGLVEYRKQNFFFGPGTLNYPTDLFPEFKNVMPGDQLTQQVKIVHNAGRSYNIRVYIKAEGSNLRPEFIRQMNLNVKYKDGDILYEGPDYDATNITEWQKLVTLAPGKSADLDLTLDVPIEMGNDFAMDEGTVIWKFKVEEIPIDTSNAKTGDNIMTAVAVLAVSALGLIAVVLFQRKKKHTN